MNINIKPNDYKEVTECRNEVVQLICDSFLSDTCWRTFHPGDNGRYRTRTDLVFKDGGGFTSHPHDNNMFIHKCEVELAVKLLLKNGYYLYRCYEYGSWVGYQIRKSPRITDMVRVESISASDWSGYFK